MSHAKQTRAGRTGSRFEGRGRRFNKRTSDAYHRQPLLEALEQRRLLTSVTGVDPLPGTHEAPVTADISAVFDPDINPATVSAESFAVHGSQTGQIRESISVNGNAITLSPTAALHPGELVEITATGGIEDLAGEPTSDPFVWQFRAGVGPESATGFGTGVFSDTGQSLGNEGAAAVALGDLDGDGDLDAFVANPPHVELWNPARVWLNDGVGNFHDNGQFFDSSRDVALGDVDGDGDLDAVTVSYRNPVWLNDGTGSFQFSGQILGGGSRYAEAVTLGDLDGDGDLDALLANSRAPDEVWLNDGAGNFRDSGQRLGDAEDYRVVALGDLDGDGDLDAVLTDYFRSTPWMNDGAGSFVEGTRIGESGGAGEVTLGDVDADGDLDAIMAHFGRTEDRVNRVWLNNGTGAFLDSGQTLGPGSGDVALADVDGDGDLDAFLAGRDGPDFRTSGLWLNDGEGNFQDSGQDLGNDYGQAVTVGDLDRDGDVDAFFANRGPDRVWLNVEIVADLSISNNNGRLFAMPGEPVTYTIIAANAGPENVSGVTVADFFPDQMTNITWTCAATEGSSCSPSGSGNIDDTVSLMAGGMATYTATGVVDANTEGTIRNVATVAAPEGLQDLRPTNNTAVDVDVIAPLQLQPQANLHTAPSDTMISATYRGDIDPATVTTESFVAHAMQTGRLVEPGSRVIVEEDTVSLWPNQPLRPGELVEVTSTSTIKHENGADTPQFVWQFRAGVGPDFATGLGTGDFESHQRLGDSFSDAVALGDLDGDGDLDAFVENFFYGDRNNKVWLNDGEANFQDSGQSLGFDVSLDAALGDVDVDGDLDVFIANRDGSKVWLNIGAGRFRDSGQTIREGDANGVALGDVDGDGDLDAFLANSGDFSNQPNEVWLNDGQGNFEDGGQRIESSSAVALGDLDGDGDLDAFLADYGANEVWLNDGAGNFQDSGQSLGYSSSRNVALGDVDADGDLDAFVANGQANTVWVNDGAGNFGNSGQNLGNSLSHEVTLGDLDGDGDLDAVVANGSVPSPNIIWLNNGRGTFRASGESLGNAYTNAVAVGDLDGDGDLDVFLGIRGPNEVWLNLEPPLIPGDINLDGNVNGLDVGPFVDVLLNGTNDPTVLARGDMDQSGEVNGLDVDPFVAAVVGNDFLAWQIRFGITMGATRSDGDADHDGDVDGDDFLIRQASFGTGSTAGGASAALPARSRSPQPRDSAMPRRRAVDETFAELDRTSARWTKRSLRDELLDDLALFK